MGGGINNGHSRGGGLHKNSASSACIYLRRLYVYCTVAFHVAADVLVTFSQKQHHKNVMSLNVRSLERHHVKIRHDACFSHKGFGPIAFPFREKASNQLSQSEGASVRVPVTQRLAFYGLVPNHPPRHYHTYLENRLISIMSFQ